MCTGAGSRAAGLLTVVALAAGVVVSGATVEIVVTERGAGAVPNQTVVLYTATQDAAPHPFIVRRPAGQCTTGPSGRCQVAELPVGVYVPVLPSIADPNLSAPLGSPKDAYGTVTVPTQEALALLRIELQRGVRIQFRVVSAKAPIPEGTKIEVYNASGETTSTRLDASGAARITLASGRWIMQLAMPSPARVTRVELDGAEVSTLEVTVDLVAPSSDRYVTWTLSAPCVVWGSVKSDRSPPAIAIGAKLLVPGPWDASPLCRDRNCAGSPSAAVGATGRYAVEVPSGTWRIAPTGESLIESKPPFLDVTCGEGGNARADFDVRETDPLGSKTVLVVQVVGPDRAPLPDVPVEVWPERGKLEAVAPIAVESTGLFFMPAQFSKLAAGSYLVRARRSGYRPAVAAVPDLDPEAREPRFITIDLDKGATIDALVRDDKDQPITGCGLEVKRTGDPPGAGDPAASLAASDAEISVPPTKDQTGHVVVTGLSGGTYDVTPVWSGALADASVATISSGDGKAEKHVIVTLGDHDTRELAVRVTPAPSFTGRLVCVDGGLISQQVAVCLLGLPNTDEDESARAACRKSLLATGSVALTGDRSDTFRVGPLTEGSYRLGLRPAGYARWTWALGTPHGEDAAVLQVEGTDPVDLGAIPVHCGPAIELQPTVASGDPLPDLTVALVEAELTRKSPAGTSERRVLTAEKDRDRVVFRELPEGEWTLDVSISHPFFVPPGPVRLSAPVELERGRMVPRGIAIASIGGAIAIDEGSGAARLTGSDGTARVVAAKDGAIAVDGVVAGTYQVESCEDASCARIFNRWDAVPVVRGRKVVLAQPAR